MMRTRMFVLSLTVFLLAAVAAQAVTIPVTNKAPRLEVTADGSSSITFRVEVGQVKLHDVTASMRCEEPQTMR